MARQHTRTSRHRKPATPAERSLSRMTVWAFALAVVFSIGLIAGQRMLHSGTTPPLVSLSSAQLATPHAVQPTADAAPTAEQQPEEVEFSFYEQLGQQRPAASAKDLRETLNQALKVQDASALPARYTLQLGAYPSMEQARKQLDKLDAQGVEAHVTTTKTAEAGKVYRVRIGKFHSMDEARQFQGALQAQRQLETFLMPL